MTNITITIVVVLVAVGVIGGVLLFGGNGNSTSGSAVPAEVLRNEKSHTLSEAEDDKVTVVEFLDFQCPACAQYYQQAMKGIEEDYQGKINLVPRNFPVENIHPLAMPAARAAEAAGIQGKYTEMYHQIMDNYQSWAVAEDGQNVNSNVEQGEQAFEGFAKEIGLDMAKYRKDLESDQVTEQIEKDQEDAQEAGVEGTPTIFINGEQFEPGQGGDVAQQLRGKIDEALNE
ncbi:protein-disulfide isomerase [Tamaricihabitans halophyticus]|uniref:Protein-disulfide isomerase n=2 Tax=Tamaricihabitans halophyticus TaxID=1262583 RepID=A0A4R2R9T4_9PSEU|nr:protein-disulfide isomerase [Tamaricihabitans halophyticus]